MEVAAVGEKDDFHGVAENVMFGQMAPMGTGAFDVALDIDMLKDAIVDHRLPIQSMLAAQIDGSMTPGQVAMTPYDTNPPDWSQDGIFRGDPTSAAFCLWHRVSPHGAGGMSPGGPGYSPSSPDAYSPTFPSFVPCSPYGAPASPLTNSYPTSPFYRNATSQTYSQSHLSWVLADQPKIFTNVAVVLTNFASLRSSVSFVQSNATSLLTCPPIFQSYISQIFSDFVPMLNKDTTCSSCKRFRGQRLIALQRFLKESMSKIQCGISIPIIICETCSPPKVEIPEPGSEEAIKNTM